MSDILFIVFFINFFADADELLQQQPPAIAIAEQRASVAPTHFIKHFDVLMLIIKKIPPLIICRLAILLFEE